MPPSEQKDLFSVPQAGQRLELSLFGIPAPRMLGKKGAKRRPVHYHIPSFKNSKRWVTKLPNGKPLKRPLLITSPEFQQWMEKAAQSLESQCISKCQTGNDATPLVRSKLFAMLSQLPEDDSVHDLPEGAWTVEIVPPGQEGAVIVIEKIQ